jgi:hypothetical protein
VFYQRLLRRLAFLFSFRVQYLVDMEEKMPVQEQVGYEQGSVSFFIQFSHLNCTRRKKLTLTFVFLQGFVVQMGNCKWQKPIRLQAQ